MCHARGKLQHLTLISIISIHHLLIHQRIPLKAYYSHRLNSFAN